jgi:predicted O-methyltransferase YrrM
VQHNRYTRVGIAAALSALVLASGGPAALDQARATKKAAAPEPARADGLSPEVVKILAEIKRKDTGQLAVSEEDGRFLRLMIATSGAKRALEIGGASGYSAIWMGHGLRATGGRLVTIEYEPERAKELADNIRRAGLSDVVEVVAGDAFAQIPKIAGSFDFVFLDAWKKDYKRFFDTVYPRLSARGLFVAHNVINKRNEMEDFLAAVQTHPSLWTTIVSPSGEGMSVSMKTK